MVAYVSVYYVLVLFQFYMGILSSYFPISYMEIRCYFIHQTQHFNTFSHWFPTVNQTSVQLVLEAFLWLGLSEKQTSPPLEFEFLWRMLLIGPLHLLSSRLSPKSIVSIISMPMEVMPFNSMEGTHFYSRCATGLYPDPPKENTLQDKQN